MRFSSLPALVMLGLAMAACTTLPTADVTRFHLNQPIPLDTVSVVAGGVAAPTLEEELKLKAVADELAKLGFRPVPNDGTSAYVATLRAEQTSREGAPREGSPINIGIGGGTFSRNVGVSGGMNFPLGGGQRSGPRVLSNLVMLDIKRRSDNTVVWEGRAMQEVSAKDPAASPGPGIARLVKALFNGFPGPSGEMVKVPTP
jgi:hypothetical protein